MDIKEKNKGKYDARTKDVLCPICESAHKIEDFMKIFNRAEIQDIINYCMIEERKEHLFLKCCNQVVEKNTYIEMLKAAYKNDVPKSVKRIKCPACTMMIEVEEAKKLCGNAIINEIFTPKKPSKCAKCSYQISHEHILCDKATCKYHVECFEKIVNDSKITECKCGLSLIPLKKKFAKEHCTFNYCMKCGKETPEWQTLQCKHSLCQNCFNGVDQRFVTREKNLIHLYCLICKKYQLLSKYTYYKLIDQIKLTCCEIKQNTKELLQKLVPNIKGLSKLNK